MRVTQSTVRVVTLVLGFLSCVVARGSGVVTNANETSLQSALRGGGVVGLVFDGALTVTKAEVIAADTILDATGHRVKLSAANKTRLFVVTNGATLTLSNLTLADGN